MAVQPDLSTISATNLLLSSGFFALVMEPDTPQYSTFKDCLATHLLSKYSSSASSENDGDDLADFASYLAAEAWPVVPDRYQNATYEAHTNGSLGDLDVDELPLDALSPAFVDTLTSYGQAEDTDDVEKFLRKVLGKYVEEVTAPPPVWSSTRTKECEICEREVPLTYHHLVPRSVHTKALKKGWHSEAMLNKVAWLCRSVHRLIGFKNLDREEGLNMEHCAAQKLSFCSSSRCEQRGVGTVLPYRRSSAGERRRATVEEVCIKAEIRGPSWLEGLSAVSS